MKPERLDELLARGNLSGPIRDRILEGALRDAQITRPAWYGRRGVSWGSSLLAAAALGVLALTFRHSSQSLRSKGMDGGAPVISLECTRGTADRCSQEGMLLFRIERADRLSYLSAYADPLAGGPKVWFFPLEDGSEPTVV